MMGLGFALVKAGVLRSGDSRVLTIMMLYLIMPAVLIRSFQIEVTEEVRSGFLLALLAAVLIHIILIPSVKLAGKALSLDTVEKGSVIYSNAGNLIVPLVTALFGEDYIIYSSAFLCVQQVLLWTHGQALMGGEKQANWKKILLNPNMIAIFFGILLMFLHVRLPELLVSTMSSLSQTIGPISMIMIGMLLGGLDFREVFSDKKIYLVTFLKMIASPLLVLVFLKVSHLAYMIPEGKTVLLISFLAVMTPSAAMVTQFAQLFENRPGYAGAINAVTTLLCIATMPLMTFLFTSWI